MTFTIRPALEQAVRDRVRAGPYRSVDDLINAALERFMEPQFGPGELAQLLAVGEQQVAAGHLVPEADVSDRMEAMKRQWRQGR